jgi:hypothetical protein
MSPFDDFNKSDAPPAQPVASPHLREGSGVVDRRRIGIELYARRLFAALQDNFVPVDPRDRP